MKNSRYIKIENRGKVDEDLLIKTEEFINFINFDLDNGLFIRLCPKMFYILKEKELKDDEEFGFEFTLLSDIFKGRVEIRKIKNTNNCNIIFNKRFPTKGKFVYNFYDSKLNIPIEKLNEQFEFIIKGENQQIKTGNIYLLKNGMIGIIKKYYSNSRIGIIYDEYSEEIEDYIRVEDIDKLLKEGEK